jgi:hypothetical protein
MSRSDARAQKWADRRLENGKSWRAQARKTDFVVATPTHGLVRVYFEDTSQNPALLPGESGILLVLMFGVARRLGKSLGLVQTRKGRYRVGVSRLDRLEDMRAVDYVNTPVEAMHRVEKIVEQLERDGSLAQLQTEKG